MAGASCGKVLAFVLLGAAPLVAEQTDPAFEVASIKLNRSGSMNSGVATQTGGRFTATNATLGTLIRMAYELEDAQVVGEPSWAEGDRFDILAKAEGNATDEELMGMVRSLLAERFKFAAHFETRDLPAYALTLVRSDAVLGPQLHASACPVRDQQGARTTNGQPCGSSQWNAAHLTTWGVPMEIVARALGKNVQRLVVDQSGLSGTYDLELEFTPDSFLSGGADRPLGGSASIFTAVQEQLGLKLESRRMPVPVLVIDRVERPTED